MSEEERQDVIQQARNVDTKREMEHLIEKLGEQESFQ